MQTIVIKNTRLQIENVTCSLSFFSKWAFLVDQTITCLQWRRHGFDPWAGKMPWRRNWLPTPVFLPGEFHEQRRLVGYSPWGRKELDMTDAT